MNNEEPNLGMKGLVGCILLAMAMMYLFVWTSESNSYSYGNTQYKTYDKITVVEASGDTELSVVSTKDVFETDGDKLIRVEFRTNSGDIITCEIPEAKAGEIDKKASYKGVVTYWYADKVYEEFYDTNREYYENIEEAVCDQSSIAREVKDVDFMYTNYIVDGLSTKEEASQFFIEKFETVENK